MVQHDAAADGSLFGDPHRPKGSNFENSRCGTRHGGRVLDSFATFCSGPLPASASGRPHLPPGAALFRGGGVAGNEKEGAGSSITGRRLYVSQRTAGFPRQAADPLSMRTNGASASGLSAAGCNTALFDPESAYRMMSVINNEDADI